MLYLPSYKITMYVDFVIHSYTKTFLVAVKFIIVVMRNIWHL